MHARIFMGSSDHSHGHDSSFRGFFKRVPPSFRLPRTSIELSKNGERERLPNRVWRSWAETIRRDFEIAADPLLRKPNRTTVKPASPTPREGRGLAREVTPVPRFQHRGDNQGAVGNGVRVARTLIPSCKARFRATSTRLSSFLSDSATRSRYKRRTGQLRVENPSPDMTLKPACPLTNPTAEAILVAAFERLRPRLLAMVEKRVGPKTAVRVDPEGVVHEAYLRAVPRWLAATTRPEPLDAWIFRQVLDRLTEQMRAAFGPTRDIARDEAWPDGSVAELAKKLFNVDDRPSAAFSQEERCEVLRAALRKLNDTDRQIIALRYFDDMSFPEITAILDLKANTANQRALRALMTLRKLIPRSFRPPGQSSS